MEEKGKSNRRILKLPMSGTGMSVLLVLIAIAVASLVVTPVMAQHAEVTATTTAVTEIYEPGLLDVYGNANEDDTIDMRDTTYIKLVIFGKKPKTDLADANYDGKVSMLDVGQTKLIILGKDKELTYIDIFGEAETVNKPIKRIVSGHTDRTEMLRVLGLQDKIVGIESTYVQTMPSFYPELSKLPSIGTAWSPDPEAILNVHPDVFLPYTEYGLETYVLDKIGGKEKLPGITVISLDIGAESIEESLRTFGYIFGKSKEAEEYLKWYNGYLDLIKSRTEGLLEDEKPRVLFEHGTPYRAYGQTDLCDIAGGKNIGDIIPKRHATFVDPEWVIEQNPDFIIQHMYTPISGYEVDDPSEAIVRREEILSRPELSEVTAVKEKNVYMIELNHLWRGMGSIIGIAYFAKWFHPDLFKDLDPEAIHKEYLGFQNVDYDLDEHGIFAYPPIEVNGNLEGIPDKYKGQL